MKIFPFMPQFYASKFLEENVKPNILNIDNIRKSYDIEAIKKKSFWPSWGEQISWLELNELREKVYNSVSDYMNRQEFIQNTKAFDQLMYKAFHKNIKNMFPSLASHSEVWNFFNVCLFPDIVVYRWRQKNGTLNYNDRFFSSARNYCGSMWWRNYFFYDEENLDPYWILNELNEDDFVQIMERVKVRGYPNIAKLLGKKIIEIRRNFQEDSILKDVIIRHLIIEIRVQALDYDFNECKKEELETVLQETYKRIKESRSNEYFKNRKQFEEKYKLKKI